MLERLLDYSRKLRILRQIMSNKARRYSVVNTTANLATVVVASSLTFMGFAGIPKITAYLNMVVSIEEPTVELIFNLLVFGLFVLVILHLVFRFNSRQSEAERAIVSLTHLSNQVDDIFARAETGYVVSQVDLALVRERYDILVQVIPPNSDREYLRAKKDYQEKEEQKLSLQLSAIEAFDATAQRRTLQALLRNSSNLMSILDAIRQVDERLFLGGGLIRNVVWDYLHGYSSPTPIDDVDVIYFDNTSLSKSHDDALEKRLRLIIPNLQWSVKNQARMGKTNQNEYASLEDAVAKWPETATSILARLTEAGEIEFLAPHGYGDLFRLVVAPTEHFRQNLHGYRERIRKKNWSVHWPRLRFFDLESDTSGKPPERPPTENSARDAGSQR